MAILTTLMHNEEYAAAVRACSSMTVTADIATTCVLAACREHAIAKARSWAAALVGLPSKLLVDRCKQLGVRL